MEWIDMLIDEQEKLTKKMWYYFLYGKLVKQRKPCFIGDRIHIRSRQGIYLVEDVNAKWIWLSTKTQNLCVNWEDFKCLASLPTQGKSVYAELRRARRNLLQFEIKMLEELDRINSELKGGF